MSTITVPFYISHQGCPHTCSFCDQRLISGDQGKLPEADEIFARVMQWEGTAQGRSLEVAFFGGTFTLLPPHDQARLLDPLQPLLRAGRVNGIRISTRPDSIDPQKISWLAARGVTAIELGVQSMDDGVLSNSGRGHDAASSEAALACIRNAGLSAVAQLMPGLPGDSVSLSLSSLRRVIGAGADSIRLYPVVVFRGTGLAELFKTGRFLPPDREKVIYTCKILLLEAWKASVTVLRIGLQSNGNDFDGTMLAGYWHPALGHLVRSSLFLDLLLKLAAHLTSAGPLAIFCHPKRISDVIGNRRSNLEHLYRRGWMVGSVTPDNRLALDELVLCHPDGTTRGSVLDLDYAI